MSGGKRIDDHAAWMGMGSRESILPRESKIKNMSDARNDAHDIDYEDTAPAIERAQNMNASKAKSHPMKAGFRQ